MALVKTGSQLNLTDIVDAEVIYTESLYNPTPNSNNLSEITFEILNGGLTSANFGGADRSLKAHQVDMGAFAQGYFFGFDRTDFLYAEQFNLKTETSADTLHSTQRIVHSSLTCNVFLPWDAKCIQYGYQALFAHDCTQYNASFTGDEFYDLSLQIGNELDPNTLQATGADPALYLYQKLPHNRYATNDAGTVTHSSVDYSPIALEESFRYVSKTGMVSGTSAPDKGYLQVRLTVGCRIYNTDARKSKIKTPSGSIWIMALR